MRDVILFGEHADDIARALMTMKFDFAPGGPASVSGAVDMNGPLLRAMYRAEAELLLEDAEAMARGGCDFRTPSQRRADAFVLVATRLGDAVRHSP